MKYMLLIHDDEKAWGRLSDGDRQKLYAEYGQFGQQIKAARTLHGRLKDHDIGAQSDRRLQVALPGQNVAHQLDLSTASATRGRASSIRGRAPRPSDLRLDVARFEKAIGRVLPTLREEIERL